VALGEAGLDGALQGLDVDRHRADRLVFGKLGLDAGGDGRVVHILTDGGLLAGHGATGGGEGQQAGQRKEGGGFHF
jgi:hypothetical protein